MGWVEVWYDEDEVSALDPEFLMDLGQGFEGGVCPQGSVPIPVHGKGVLLDVPEGGELAVVWGCEGIHVGPVLGG